MRAVIATPCVFVILMAVIFAGGRCDALAPRIGEYRHPATLDAVGLERYLDPQTAAQLLEADLLDPATFRHLFQDNYEQNEAASGKVSVDESSGAAVQGHSDPPQRTSTEPQPEPPSTPPTPKPTPTSTSPSPSPSPPLALLVPSAQPAPAEATTTRAPSTTPTPAEPKERSSVNPSPTQPKAPPQSQPYPPSRSPPLPASQAASSRVGLDAVFRVVAKGVTDVVRAQWAKVEEARSPPDVSTVLVLELTPAARRFLEHLSARSPKPSAQYLQDVSRFFAELTDQFTFAAVAPVPSRSHSRRSKSTSSLLSSLKPIGYMEYAREWVEDTCMAYFGVHLDSLLGRQYSHLLVICAAAVVVVYLLGLIGKPRQQQPSSPPPAAAGSGLISEGAASVSASNSSGQTAPAVSCRALLRAWMGRLLYPFYAHPYTSTAALFATMLLRSWVLHEAELLLQDDYNAALLNARAGSHIDCETIGPPSGWEMVRNFFTGSRVDNCRVLGAHMTRKARHEQGLISTIHFIIPALIKIIESVFGSLTRAFTMGVFKALLAPAESMDVLTSWSLFLKLTPFVLLGFVMVLLFSLVFWNVYRLLPARGQLPSSAPNPLLPGPQAPLSSAPALPALPAPSGASTPTPSPTPTPAPSSSLVRTPQQGSHAKSRKEKQRTPYAKQQQQQQQQQHQKSPAHPQQIPVNVVVTLVSGPTPQGQPTAASIGAGPSQSLQHKQYHHHHPRYQQHHHHHQQPYEHQHPEQLLTWHHHPEQRGVSVPREAITSSTSPAKRQQRLDNVDDIDDYVSVPERGEVQNDGRVPSDEAVADPESSSLSGAGVRADEKEEEEEEVDHDLVPSSSIIGGVDLK